MSYQSVILADNPIGYWRLNETSGVVAADLSPNANDGAITGGVVLNVPGLLDSDPGNTAFSFDGTDDWVEIPETPAYDITGAVTLEVWANRDSATSSGDVIGKRGAYALRFLGSTIRFAPWGSNFDVSHAVPAGQDTHIVATHDATGDTVYVNGVEVGSRGFVSDPPLSNDPLGIGHYNTAWFDGTIDEPALYNYALSSTQVAAHYAAASAHPRTRAFVVGG